MVETIKPSRVLLRILRYFRTLQIYADICTKLQSSSPINRIEHLIHARMIILPSIYISIRRLSIVCRCLFDNSTIAGSYRENVFNDTDLVFLFSSDESIMQYYDLFRIPAKLHRLIELVWHRIEMDRSAIEQTVIL